MYKFETSKYIGHWIPDNRPTKTLKTYKKKITKSKQIIITQRYIYLLSSSNFPDIVS